MTRCQMTATTARAGATLGLAAGAIELTLGPQIRALVGGKADPTRLGVVTLTLALVALAAAVRVSRGGRPSSDATLALAAGLGIPGLIGFTTVGPLWMVPGPLLLAATAGVLCTSGHSAGRLAAALEDRTSVILAVALALLYVLLGLTAIHHAGVAGILGGVIVLILIARPRRWRPAVVAILVGGAVLPFAALTWWSLVVPAIGVALVGTTFAVVRSRSSATGVTPGAARSTVRP